MHGFSTGAVWFDYDNDGFLDLFVCRYVEWTVKGDNPCTNPDGAPGVCTPDYYKASTDVLYHNNGDGAFTEVTHKAGIGKVRSRSLGVAAADFHGTGRLDLFVANDIGPNFLYRDQGDGTFEEVGAQEGVALGSRKSQPMANMGVAVGDYDEDGDLDVLVTTFSGESYSLFRNDGGYFTDVCLEVGLAAPTFPNLGFRCRRLVPGE